MSRRLQRVGDANDGGGVIKSTPQTTVFANGLAVAVWGSKGSGHARGRNQHQHDENVWSTRGDNTSVRIECHAVNLTGDRDTCGHSRLGGSSDIFIGEDYANMACQSTDVSYITPEGITTLYTPSAQRTMGGEAPGVISRNDPENPIMENKEQPEAPPDTPVTCDEFNADTPDSVQLSTNYRLSDVTLNTVFPHRAAANRGLSRPQIICNLKKMCENIAEPLRAHVVGLGHPRITITSTFRPYNDNSHHSVGAAFDVQVISMKPTEMFELAQWCSTGLPCDQLILEGVGASKHWIHLSMNLNGTRSVAAASRVLTQTTSGGYSAGLFLLNYNGSKVA